MNLREVIEEVKGLPCYVFHEKRTAPFLAWAQQVAGFKVLFLLENLCIPKDASDSVLVVGSIRGDDTEELVEALLEEHLGRWQRILYLKPRHYHDRGALALYRHVTVIEL